MNWKLGVFVFCCILLSLSFLMMAVNKSEGVAGQVMLIDQSKVAYGGILNELSTITETSDPDLTKVIEFATQYADKNHPTTVLKDVNGKILEPSVSSFQKLKLQGTKDGETQHYLVVTTFVGSKQQFQHRKVIYGLTYSFCLTWTNIVNSYKHNFAVSLDRERRMYVFQHTLNRDSQTPTSSSDPVDVAAHIATDELMTSSQSECLQEGDGSAVDQSECELSTSNLWKQKRTTEGGECTEKSLSCEKDAKKAKPGHRDFSIVTQNIWNFNGIPTGTPSQTDEAAYIARLSRLGDLMAGTNADIIGLQEVRFDVNSGGHLGPCQVQQLANHLPKYQYVYQPAVNYVPDNFERSEEGLAIFSLHPIVSHDFILLSRDMNDEDDKCHQRICLHAEIDTPSLGIIHVFVTHLSLSEAARERSVVEIWGHMSKFTGLSVLIGDLNADPQSKVIRFLRGELEINGVKTEGLQDAWLMKNKEPRVGVRAYSKGEPRDDGLTFSTLEQHLRERIDYVFVRLPGHMQMTDISLVDGGGRGPMAASDHLGLKTLITGL